MMEGWKDHLHFALGGEHVLFPGLRLDSFLSFLTASLFATFLGLSERFLTFTLSKHWTPWSSVRKSRLRIALWRATLYWIVTFERLLYMLLAMTFHVPLIMVTVTALSVGQFFIEYVEVPPPSPQDFDTNYSSVKEPLMGATPQPILPSSSSSWITAPVTRPRAKSRSKPSAIFIHPEQSNIARADAVALELGFGGDTERVRAQLEPGPWHHGHHHGREAARAIFSGGSGRGLGIGRGQGGPAPRRGMEDSERRPLYHSDTDSDEHD